MLRQRMIRIGSSHTSSSSETVMKRFVSSDSSSNGGITAMLNKLRLQAADVLTSSLNEQDRRKILQKFEVNVGDNNADNKDHLAQETIQRTMGEAVAAARIQEAQKLNRKWQTEKATLLREAEEAVRARIESEFLVQQRRTAMERWKKDLEQEKAQEQKPDHPLLGKLIQDFGYKKLYSVPAKLLSTIPVWKKQRIYRHDRAKTILADKLKTAHFGMPGIICLLEDPNGDLSILDGQHRVGAMTLLANDKPHFDGFDLNNILVELYSSTSSSSETENFAEDLFSEINKAEPVKLVDMPGIAKKGERKILTDAATQLADQFPDMFKPTQKCRAPHLNIDNLRDALFAANVLRKYDMKTPKALVDWMMERNGELEKHFADEQNAAKVSAIALRKAHKFNFYLGLDSSWFYK